MSRQFRKSRRTNIPIIFSAPMIRALLDGQKTHTRRLIRGAVPQAPAMDNIHPSHKARHPAPYLDSYCGERKTPSNSRGMSDHWCWWARDDRCGSLFRVGYAPGDRLWVREQVSGDENGWSGEQGVRYMADDTLARDMARDPRFWKLRAYAGAEGRTVPSIHMPRWASRLTLVVTNVRVQRLQEISEEDSIAEGLHRAPGGWWSGAEGQAGATPKAAFAVLWNSLHGHGSWASNPWVVALTFSVERGNIDTLAGAGSV